MSLQRRGVLPAGILDLLRGCLGASKRQASPSLLAGKRRIRRDRAEQAGPCSPRSLVNPERPSQRPATAAEGQLITFGRRSAPDPLRTLMPVPLCTDDVGNNKFRRVQLDEQQGL